MTDQTRKEFEEWLWRTWPEPDMAAHKGKEFLFMVWQASRAALVIELPEGFETYCGSTEERVIYADEMKGVLVAAGLKVKP